MRESSLEVGAEVGQEVLQVQSSSSCSPGQTHAEEGCGPIAHGQICTWHME